MSYVTRTYSLKDRVIMQIDSILRRHVVHAPSPADTIQDTENLSPTDQKLSTSLMRINHSGEVCAQALYQGQALVARDDRQYISLIESAAEENDHLHWCKQRLIVLQARPSLFNPIFYVASFGIGLVAGIAGDKVSLGFLAETEDQVSRHLDNHLYLLPYNDLKSRAILERMRTDELRHAANAKLAGGMSLPYAIKILMRYTAKILTAIAGRI